MLLNTVQNAAKCKVIKHIYPLQWHKQNLFEPLKTWLKGSKYPLKSAF